MFGHFFRDEACCNGLDPGLFFLGTQNPSIMPNLLRADGPGTQPKNSSRKSKGWEPRRGASQDHRPWPSHHRVAGEVAMATGDPPPALLLQGKRERSVQQVCAHSEYHCGLGFAFALLTTTFGDCLIMARYKHQVTFCKVVTAGEGYNYSNEATLAPDSFPSNQSKCHCSYHLPQPPPGPPGSPLLHPFPRPRQQSTIQEGVLLGLVCIQGIFLPFLSLMGSFLLGLPCWRGRTKDVRWLWRQSL